MDKDSYSSFIINDPDFFLLSISTMSSSKEKSMNYIVWSLYMWLQYIRCANFSIKNEVGRLRIAIDRQISHVNTFFNQASLQDCFSTKTHNRHLIALDYVKGLLTSPGRCHLTAISQNCSDVNNQTFSHFIAQSTLNYRIIYNCWDNCPE